MPAAAETAPEDTRSAAEVLAINHLVKRFPGTIAVDDVSFAVERGAIHALVGENGAGKSTIIKLLSGVYQPDGGQILVRGEPTRIRSPHHAQELGVTTIHQEQTLIDSLTAIENVFLGREHLRGPLRRALNIVDAGRMRREVLNLFEDFEFDIRQLGRFVRDLSGLDKQIVEIVKALAFRSEVIIMDEPTAGLTEHERVALFRHMRRLQDRETAILWVTHRLEELEGMADRVHVLRDARLVGTLTKEEVTPARVVRMMIGRDVDSMESFVAEQRGATVEASDDDEVLRVEGLSRGHEFADVSFMVRRGEILG
ncbi:MAG: ATP-binding cassette domain-containing protein, partial [Spirochaetaceae bacterium]|nr:ATP-binding cassette domain-containing protein [Spirochaetaceae bacterium]